MILVKFKNLDKSELARDAVHNRIEGLIEKFGDLKDSRIMVTLEMINSPQQAGPDLFRVKLYVAGGRYSGITVIKSDANLYVALAEVAEHMLEALNRFGDRVRVKERKKARDITNKLIQQALLSKS